MIFGNPKGGTALMQDRQSTEIDLPLKALVWEDSDGKAWVTYNDPNWVAQRHSLGTGSTPAVKAMTALLSAIAQEATSSSCRFRHNHSIEAPMIQHYSDHAANERTFLAWVRTSIAVMGFGFLIERFDIFLSHHSVRSVVPAGGPWP